METAHPITGVENAMLSTAPQGPVHWMSGEQRRLAKCSTVKRPLEPKRPVLKPICANHSLTQITDRKAAVITLPLSGKSKYESRFGPSSKTTEDLRIEQHRMRCNSSMFFCQLLTELSSSALSWETSFYPLQVFICVSFENFQQISSTSPSGGIFYFSAWFLSSPFLQFSSTSISFW